MTDYPNAVELALGRIGDEWTVRVTEGTAEVERKVRVHLFDEDGQPVRTANGRQRYRLAPGTAQVVSHGVRLAHPAGQRQFAAWVDGTDPWAIAWPADRSDIPRRIGVAQLGTLVDLDHLRERAIERARAEIGG